MRISRSKSKPGRGCSAQQAALAGLRQGDLQPLDGQRILGPDVDIARLRHDGVGGDDHALDDTGWCGSPSSTLRSMKAPGSPSSALHTTYLSSPTASRVNFHFRHVGKPAPPRPRSPETLHRLNHLLRVVGGKHSAQGLIAVVADVVFDALRIDGAAVGRNTIFC